MKTVIFLMLMGTSAIAFSQYKPAEQNSTLKFTIKNLGFDVDGTFSGFDGSVAFDPQHPDSCNFNVSLAAASVNTGNSLRDEHLKGENYFDVKNFPRINLASTKITPVKKDVYRFEGKLTIKKTSKPVAFLFTAAPVAEGFLFTGSFNMKRKDFEVGGTSTISDDLKVMINVTAKHV